MTKLMAKTQLSVSWTGFAIFSIPNGLCPVDLRLDVLEKTVDQGLTLNLSLTQP